jgi:hypothetical protein
MRRRRKATTQVPQVLHSWAPGARRCVLLLAGGGLVGNPLGAVTSPKMTGSGEGERGSTGLLAPRAWHGMAHGDVAAGLGAKLLRRRADWTHMSVACCFGCCAEALNLTSRAPSTTELTTFTRAGPV